MYFCILDGGRVWSMGILCGGVLLGLGLRLGLGLGLRLGIELGLGLGI